MRLCEIEGCGRKHDARGLCKMHNMRRWRYGDPLAEISRPQNRGVETCTFPGCSNPHDSFGLCRTHRVRQIKHGDPAYTVPSKQKPTCADCGCKRRPKSRDAKAPGHLCRSCARIRNRAARPTHYLAKLAARRRRVRIQTPPWADLAAIEQFYQNRPAGHEVDHIVPLKAMAGRRHVACGLHVEHNLQYLPMPDNRRKGARLRSPV